MERVALAELGHCRASRKDNWTDVTNTPRETIEVRWFFARDLRVGQFVGQAAPAGMRCACHEAEIRFCLTTVRQAQPALHVESSRQTDPLLVFANVCWHQQCGIPK